MSKGRSDKKKRHNSRACESSASTDRVHVETKKQYKGSKAGKLPGPGSLRGLKALRFFEGDLDLQTSDRLQKKEYLAIDTETEGLDYRKHKLRLIQIGTEDGRVYIIRNPRPTSANLDLVLLSPHSTKVFHHAMFDLRFIKTGMKIEVQGPIECTKVLMKISKPQHKSGIGAMLKNTIGRYPPIIKVDYSKWNEPALTRDQLLYAAGDVIDLVKAFKKLKKSANWDHLAKYERAMKVCINMAFLQVEGYTDLFDYPQNSHDMNIEQRNWWLYPSPAERELVNKLLGEDNE